MGSRAIDYTPSRYRGQIYAVVETYMAHHQGMSLCRSPTCCGIDRCEAIRIEPQFQATELLLRTYSSNRPVRRMQ